MRKQTIPLITCLMLFIASCGNHAPTSPPDERNVDSKHFVSENEAIQIASKFLGLTRADFSKFTISYITPVNNTRTETSPIAYVLNENDGDGWLLIASDNRIHPILAFSDQGSFDINLTDNHPVQSMFIEKLPDIYNNFANDSLYILEDSQLLPACFLASPSMSLDLGQFKPWDKYVIVDHPGCPAGCVPVATLNIMLHCKQYITYNGQVYDLEGYLESYELHKNRGAWDNEYNDVYSTFGLYPVNYTAFTIKDKLSYLLYEIGKNIGATYSTTGTGAKSNNALAFLRNYGYDLNNSYTMRTFDPQTVTDLLYGECHMILMEGWDYNNPNNPAGHDWVLDGVMFCWADQLNKIGYRDVYYHCRWGWNGSNDGYYSANAFNPSGYLFNDNLKYHEVRIESRVPSIGF